MYTHVSYFPEVLFRVRGKNQDDPTILKLFHDPLTLPALGSGGDKHVLT